MQAEHGIVVTQQRTASAFWLFVLRYALWSLALFGLLYIDKFSPLIALSNLQTELHIFLTARWIEHFNIPVVMDGARLQFDHGLVLEIVNQCNGLAAVLLFVAATLAYPTQMATRLRWSLLAYMILLVANTIRLCWITFHVIEYPQDFVFAHEVLGRYGIALIPLILFYLFVHKAPALKSS